MKLVIDIYGMDMGPEACLEGVAHAIGQENIYPVLVGEEALIRECREELDITVEPKDVFMEVIHEYLDLTVRLTLFNAVIAAGVPKALEHNDIRWITTAEIDGLDFCPADEEILERLKKM